MIDFYYMEMNMIEKKKKWFKISIWLLAVAVIYTVLVKYVDVKAIGPGSTKVGFAAMNGWFKDLIGYNKIFYTISKYAGVIPFLFCAYYGFMGIMDLIKKKSFKKVDFRYYVLACFYVIFVAMYFFFEKAAINYRPIIVDVKEGIEASYPSTHTLLAICLCGSSLIVSKFFIKNETLRKLADIAAWCLMVVIVVARLISGVHWLSDIIGGIIISLTYLSFLKLSLLRMDAKDLTTA